MKHAYKNLRVCVNHAPLGLLALPPKLQDVAERMLPYSTGIEIECLLNSYSPENGQDYNRADEITQEFERIPDIMKINFSQAELRFRIPPGIKGMICLFRICQLLKKNAKLNPQSGIHYHVDFTDVWEQIPGRLGIFNRYVDEDFMKSISPWVLKSLKSWNYTGDFNAWEVSDRKTAVKFHPEYETVEFRIGEMTFDYSLMIKRIIHAQNISRRIKKIALSLKSPKKDESAKPLKKAVQGEW